MSESAWHCNYDTSQMSIEYPDQKWLIAMRAAFDALDAAWPSERLSILRLQAQLPKPKRIRGYCYEPPGRKIGFKFEKEPPMD